MSANEHERGRARAARRRLLLVGLVIITSLALWLVPGELWLRGELAAIDGLEAEARRLGGSASIQVGGIDVGERRIGVFLKLADTGIGDADLARLAAMPAFRHVRTLSLARTRVTGGGLGPLEGNPNLIAIDLSGSRVSDEGLKSILTLPFLTDLYLRGTEVSDAGLDILIERRDRLRISSIDLRGTKVTDDGVKSLSSAFHQLVIEHPAARHPMSNAQP